MFTNNKLFKYKNIQNNQIKNVQNFQKRKKKKPRKKPAEPKILRNNLERKNRHKQKKMNEKTRPATLTGRPIIASHAGRVGFRPANGRSIGIAAPLLQGICPTCPLSPRTPRHRPALSARCNATQWTPVAKQA
jgi:Fe-S cluster biogenesis protein NfuA